MGSAWHALPRGPAAAIRYAAAVLLHGTRSRALPLAPLLRQPCPHPAAPRSGQSAHLCARSGPGAAPGPTAMGVVQDETPGGAVDRQMNRQMDGQTDRQMDRQTDRQTVVLAALGGDRPGLVAQLSRYVAERGGNVEDSRMAALGGLFGVMAEITGPAVAVARIARDAPELERAVGVRVMIEPAPGTRAPAQRPDASGVLLGVTASAFDREGLLLELSDVMRSTGGNIVALDTTTYEELGTGHVYFRTGMSVEVSDERDAETLRQRLRRLSLTEGMAVEVAVARPGERLAEAS